MKRKLSEELKEIKHMNELGKDLVFIGNSSQPGQHRIRANRNQILLLCPDYRLERNNYGQKYNYCNNFKVYYQKSASCQSQNLNWH